MAKVSKELKVVKKFKDGSALFSNGMCRTPVARLSFVNFVTPKENEQDDGTIKKSYGCATLFPKGADLTAIKLCCERFGKSELGEKFKRVKRKTPLREQDDKVDDYDGFVEGAWYMNNSTKYKPKCIGREKEDIEQDALYSGCYARLTLRPYFYDVKGNKGVGLGLAAVQFIRDGEPLGGGGIDPNDAFDVDESEDMESGDSSGEDDDDDNEFL